MRVLDSKNCVEYGSVQFSQPTHLPRFVPARTGLRHERRPDNREWRNRTLSSTPADSRIAVRYVFEARIKIRVIRDDKETMLIAWTRDISESGLGAFVAAPLKLLETVFLYLPLETCRDGISARVVRISGSQCGFQFTTLSSSQRSEILEAVKKHPIVSPSAP